MGLGISRFGIGETKNSRRYQLGEVPWTVLGFRRWGRDRKSQIIIHKSQIVSPLPGLLSVTL